MNFEKFKDQFKFGRFGTIGIEEEIWLVDKENNLKPAALDLIKKAAENAGIHNGCWPAVIRDDDRRLAEIKEKLCLQPELPAQQLEITSGICFSPAEAVSRLAARRTWLKLLAGRLKTELSYDPAPAAGPEDFMVFPKERYLAIKNEFGKKALAGYIAALHVHIGLSGLAQAIKVLNALSPVILREFRFAYSDERLERYFSLAGANNFFPPLIRAPVHYYEVMEEIGCLDDPTRCWWLIRLSPHGTIELRVADTTEDLRKIKIIIEKFIKLIKNTL